MLRVAVQVSSSLRRRELSSGLLAGFLGRRRLAAGVCSLRGGVRESQQIYIIVFFPACAARWRIGHGDRWEGGMAKLAELRAAPKSVRQAMLKSLPACAPEARTVPHENE